MANSSKQKYSFPVISAIIGIVAIFAAVVVFAFEVTPPTLTPTPAVTQPTSSPSSNLYFPEVIPPLTDISSPTRTVTRAPTKTPVPTQTLIVMPTLVSNSQLPDLTVTAITDPVCVPETDGTTLELNIFVRNIGQTGTRYFGSFDVGVFFILGQRRYSLEEWDTQFNGVIGSSNLEVFNLNPNDDIKFTVVIDLKGNKNFGIEVVANAGENPIRETDMTNNTLLKYFSGYCY